MGESSWNGYENNCLFQNLGGGRYLDVARATGGDDLRDGRGVAVADLDGDGRLDLVINNNNARPAIVMNRLAASGNWLALELVGSPENGSPRDAAGARVRLTLAGDGRPSTLTRWVEIGSGYAAQSPLAVHFGLGAATRVEALEIDWPSGRVDRLSGAELGVNGRVRVDEARRTAAARRRGAEGA